MVVLSADASHGVIRRLLASGALAYLTKPIELAELGELLDTFAAAEAQDQQAQPAIRIKPSMSGPGAEGLPRSLSRSLRRETQ